MKKPVRPKTKKYTLTLSEPEVRRLTAYAASSGIERPVALHRIVSAALREVDIATATQCDKRQLGLFDSVQIDIFNNTTKVE